MQIEQSLVRFRLDRGVARAISGAAAEGARERFRLNTPLVAIGVRGTDFCDHCRCFGEERRRPMLTRGPRPMLFGPFVVGVVQRGPWALAALSQQNSTDKRGDLLLEFRDLLLNPGYCNSCPLYQTFAPAVARHGQV